MRHAAFKFLWTLLPLFALCFFFAPSTNAQESCNTTGSYAPVPGQDCEQATYCNTGPTCDGACSPASSPTNIVYQRAIRFRQPDLSTCDRTVYFKSQANCSSDNPLVNPASTYQPTSLQCQTAQKINTCNQQLAIAQPATFNFSGACDTSEGVYCTQEAPGGSCPAGATGTSPGKYCETWACGFDCADRNTNSCVPHSGGGTGTYIGGAQGGLAACEAAAACNPLPTPTCGFVSCTPSDNNCGTGNVGGTDNCGQPCTVARPTCDPVCVPDCNGKSCGARNGCSGTCGSASDPGCGSDSCEILTNTVNPSDSQGACSSGQYCVQFTVNYNGLTSPVGQSWNFGDGTRGENNDGWQTYRGYNYGVRTVSISVSGTGSGGSGSTSCRKNVDIPGGTTPVPTRPGGRPPTSTPTPTREILRGTGAIRFYNADCTTAYDGEDELKVLTLAWNGADGSYENDIWREGGGHNALFYNGKRVGDPGYSHNANEGVRGCDSRAWHPYFDPGYILYTNGTVGPCGGGSGKGFRMMCEKDGDWRPAESCEVTNVHGDQEFVDCCDPGGGGSLYNRLDNGEGSCVNQDNFSNSIESCFPNNNEPTTINATSNRMNLTSTRNMRRTFSVAGPTGVKLKVIAVCVGDDPTCDWQGLQNPTSRDYNKSTVRKDFNQGTPNYYASGWDDSNAGTGSYMYDVCVQDSRNHDIGGNVYLDADCNGVSEGGLGASVTVSGTQSRGPTGTNGAGDYLFLQIPAGRNQSHTVTVAPTDLSSVWLACSGTNGTNQITYTNPDASRKTFNVGYAPVNGPWFQTADADIAAGGNIVSRIPTTCIPARGCNPYFNLDGSGGYPGVPMYGAATDFGTGNISTRGWKANTTYQGTRYDYNYMSSLVPSSVTFNNIGGGSINWTTLQGGTATNGYLWHRRTGDLIISGDANLGGSRAVLFVQGNVTINNNVTLSPGAGFLTVIASGNITIAPGVTNLQGLFLANGIVFTGTNNGADSQLSVRGALLGWGGVSLQRDLDRGRSTRANNTRPAEVITQAPDLMMLFPKELMRDSLTWREIAP